MNSISELLAIRDKLQQDLERIENIDELLSQKETEVKLLFKALLNEGKALTIRRQETGQRITDYILPMLNGLGMPSAKLKFKFTTRATPDRSGLDNVTLLFSGNKNIPEQDVSEIASGGEIARLMLALKAMTSVHRNLPTIIFDEIDTGVSGTMAEKMAQVMQQMAEHCQVICITHLPQIAACGSYHYRVYKTETESGTESHIDRLDTSQRIQEIANMLSGEQMTDAAINNAKSLLHLQ